MPRLHLVVHGRVQGVGFRAFVMRRARELALVGEVRNLPDGAVEVVAEGAPGPLEGFLGAMRRGPASARVTGVDVSWSEAAGRFEGFEIRGQG